MAKKDVLDATRKVLEFMSESEETVSLLQEEINQNDSLRQQIIHSLKELREFKNKSTVELEDNQHLKSNIKKCNEYILNAAKQIYSHCKELDSELNTLNNKLAKNEQLFNRNNELHEQNVAKYREVERTLMKQFSENEKERLEMKAISAENEKLRSEIKAVGEKISYCESYIEKEQTVFNDVISTEKVILEAQESINHKENSINEMSVSLEKTRQIKGQLETDEGQANIFEMQQQIEKSEHDIIELSSSIDNYEQLISDALKKTEILGEQKKQKEAQCIEYEKVLHNIEVELMKFKEEKQKEIICYENSILEMETELREREQVKERLKLDMSAFEKKIECQQEAIDKISEFVVNHKETDTDLVAQLRIKEEKVIELKMTLENLNGECNNRLSEVEAEINNLKREIEAKEEVNKQLLADTEALVSKQEILKNDLKQKTLRTEQQVEEMKELDKQREKVKLQIKKEKEETLKNKKATVTVKRGSAREKRERESHWDSDSSMEGVDRSLSDTVREKMKMNMLK